MNLEAVDDSGSVVIRVSGLVALRSAKVIQLVYEVYNSLYDQRFQGGGYLNRANRVVLIPQK